MKRILSLFFFFAFSATSLLAQIAPTVTTITALPFTVPVTGGTFVLASDLVCPSPFPLVAITIPANITAPVVIDLKGHSISGNLTGGYGTGNTPIGIGIGYQFIGPAVTNAFSITVKNGVLQYFDISVWVEGTNLSPLSNITISGLTLSPGGVSAPDAGNDVSFSFVENSTVKNCTFNGPDFGAEDFCSLGGNHWDNIVQNGTQDYILMEAAPRFLPPQHTPPFTVVSFDFSEAPNFPTFAPISESTSIKPITITGLPFSVPVTGGMFVLAADLSCSAPDHVAISIPSNITRPVIVDLKGHTISGDGSIAITGGGYPFINAFPISVRNGTLQGQVSASEVAGITISNLNFNGVGFFDVANSTVQNCVIHDAVYGIGDSFTAGGNRYHNIQMNNIQRIFVSSYPAGGSCVLKSCDFAPPPPPVSLP